MTDHSPNHGSGGDALNVDGLRFRDVSDNHSGDVGADTVFEYHEEGDGTIWARYYGGSIRLGHLTGCRSDGGLEFRYAHIDIEGGTASGHCVSRLEQLAGGRIRSHEKWEWDSRPGTGTSTLESEFPPR